MAARTRRGLVVALTGTAVALTALVATGVVLGPRLRSPQQAAADAAPPPASLVTVRAERRVLAEPIVLRGQVTAGASTPLLPPTAAVGESSVVTKVAVRTGQQLSEGDVVIARADEPMFALVLPFPLYRDIAPGDRGADVDAVQAVLRRLGYAVPRTGVLDAATQDAVRRLYAAKGWAGRAADGGLKRSAVVALDRPGRTVTAVHVRVGGALTDPKAPIVSLDGQPAFVRTRATRDQAHLLTAGQPVTIYDDAGGHRAAGSVGAVGTDLVAAEDGSTGVEVTLDFTDQALAGATGRAVRIDIVATSAEEVLAVPITAVLTRPDGTTFVTAVRPGGGADVTVTTGRSAGGWVAITPAEPDGVAAGVEVVVGRDFTRSSTEGS
ncbi:hypothetical protein SUDANB95_03226 [Actinosynnema sp. ALI-1.44]